MFLKNFGDYNLSTHFVYPLFELHPEYNKYLWNTYITHHEYLDAPYHFYMIFKFSGLITNSILGKDSISYLTLENNLLQHPEYFVHYDIADGQFVCFMMTIPDKFLEDYERFINGEYSKIKAKIHNSSNMAIDVVGSARDLIKTQSLKNFGTDYPARIMDKDPMVRKAVELQIGAELPKNAEVWTKYSEDSLIQAKELFIESKLPIKAL